VFTAWLEGPADGEPVVMLHGFPQSRHSWRAQVAALAAAGYRVVAPDQRGYSSGARPDPSDLAAYHVDELVRDVLEITSACGWQHRRWHLVGHDWGGMVAWILPPVTPNASRRPTVLSRPHPACSAAGDSRRMKAAQSRTERSSLTVTLPACCWRRQRRVRRTCRDGGVPATIVDCVSVLGTPR
jgi:pimeloyl-ACP methyl ester carboxylesterase